MGEENKTHFFLKELFLHSVIWCIRHLWLCHNHHKVSELKLHLKFHRLLSRCQQAAPWLSGSFSELRQMIAGLSSPDLGLRWELISPWAHYCFWKVIYGDSLSSWVKLPFCVAEFAFASAVDTWALSWGLLQSSGLAFSWPPQGTGYRLHCVPKHLLKN